jgi:hypothetical protein
VCREKENRMWARLTVRRLGCGFGAKASYNETNLFVGDFGWEGFFEGLEAVHAEPVAGGRDLVVAFGGQPAGLELGFASLDEIRDEGDDGAKGSGADLGDLFEGAAFF